MRFPPLGEPDCVALVLCEQVEHSPEGTVQSLINLFDGVIVTSLPSAKTIVVFVTLTNMERPVDFAVSVSSPSGKAIRMVPTSDPNMTMSPQDEFAFGFEFANIPITEIGRYKVEVTAGENLDDVLARRYFNVQVKQ